MSRLISFAVLIAIIIVIGLLFYKVLIGFFVPVFLAAVLVVVFRPLHHWVLERCGQREQIAAAVTTFLILLLMLLPIGIIVPTAAVQGLRLVKNNDARTVSLRFRAVRDSLGLQMPGYEPTLRTLESEIGDIADATSRLDEADPKLRRLGEQTEKSIDKLRGQVKAALEAEALSENPDAKLPDELLTLKRQQLFDELQTLAAAVGQPAEEFGVASRLAVQLRTTFSDLKTDLLGGQMKALAREWANPTEDKIQQWSDQALKFVQPRLLSLTGATGALMIKLIFGGVILIVATFFFLYDGPAMTKTVMRLSPLDDAYEQELLLEFERISRAVVLATILSAITQGLTAGIGYYFAGMDFLILLVMLTTVFAMVPFVGPAVIWVPVCLYIGLYEGRVLPACILATWGVVVVGTIDNVVKAFVLHGQSQLHPLLALLSVLGGVQTLGPVGIVVGPMVVAMLQTLLGILQRELLHFDKQNILVSTGDSGGDVMTSARTRPRKPSAKSNVDLADEDGAESNEDPHAKASADAKASNDAQDHDAQEASDSASDEDAASDGKGGRKKSSRRRRRFGRK